MGVMSVGCAGGVVVLPPPPPPPFPPPPLPEELPPPQAVQNARSAIKSRQERKCVERKSAREASAEDCIHSRKITGPGVVERSGPASCWENPYSEREACT